MQIEIPYDKNLSFSKEPSGKMQFLWLHNGCTPESGFHLCYNEKALKIRLFSKERPLFCKATEDDGKIWEDNCLEFFFAPFGKSEPYLNFECNPLGKMIIGMGRDRHERTLLTHRLKPALNLKASILDDAWAIEYEIPFAEISAIYQKEYAPKRGSEFFFNAYVCGDKADPPRYGAWSKIEWQEPDFHRPEFFGKGVLD